MPKTEVFDRFYKDCDNWFINNELAYKAELNLIGQEYEKNKDKSRFYSPATFYSAKGIEDYLKNESFSEIESYQTLFHPLHELKAVEPVTKGYGRGAFIGMRGKKVALCC